MKQREEFIHRINYLTSEMDAVYHRASLKLGISDSVSLILYTIFDAGGSCLLSEIYKKSGISKQTVNSALRGLEGKGILALQQYKGRAKKVVLTEAGREYAAQTAGRLFAAEVRALDAWPTEEINEYICLMEKYVAGLRAQIEQL